MNAYKDSTKKPRIEISDNAFKITLPNLNYHDNVTESMRSEGADSTEATVLAYIRKSEYITRAIAENLLGISPSTANRLLRELVKKSTLKITGTGRQTKYMLK